MIGFGSTRYSRVLGLTVVLLAIASLVAAPIGFLAPAVLSAGVGLKAVGVLGTLALEGKGDPDWQDTRRRAIIGLLLSGLAFIISGLWIILLFIGVFLRARPR